jgi:hypothetical protein
VKVSLSTYLLLLLSAECSDPLRALSNHFGDPSNGNRPRFAHLAHKGIDAGCQDDWHASADALLEAFKLPADQISFDDRVHLIHVLIFAFINLDLDITNQELEALHEIVNCEKEPFLVRSFGAMTYAVCVLIEVMTIGLGMHIKNIGTCPQSSRRRTMSLRLANFRLYS